ncbi:MAG: 4-alpha-glucanotransferase, partial [Bifidobacteriaceae bacterium]|nr:4-alpha-glucanotransferase [Bifidobacteriaceae bacterium]
MTPASPALARLAHAHGVATEYLGAHDLPVTVDQGPIRAVLGVLGVPAADDSQAASSLDQLELRGWTDTVAPTIVIIHGEGGAAAVTAPAGATIRAWIELDPDPLLGGAAGRVDLPTVPPLAPGEPGERKTVAGVDLRRASLELSAGLPLGWHSLRIEVDCAGGPGSPDGGGSARATLVVAPARVEWPATLLERRAWGVMAQLYSVRSRGSWGVGDFEDLALLAEALAPFGPDFVQINPLHAAEPSGHITQSPYLPTSRSFTNPLYIRPESIPEYEGAPAAVKDRVDGLAVRAAESNADAEKLDRDRSWELKREALEAVFAVGRSPARAAEFAAYRAERGQELEDFALWSVLFDAAADGGTDLPETDQLVPGSPEAKAVARARQDGVAFFAWLQWVAESQLAEAQRRALAAGMRIGIVGDLAVGVHPAGADSWILRNVLARGIEVGAPPDALNQHGQGWSEPPFRPDRLEATGYGAYKTLLRTMLAHTGGLRIDHILGLFRLWWIPSGSSPRDGTYVYYDHEKMVGILALEARRAGVVVVGEDVGVVLKSTQRYLSERGIAGNSITWFENEADEVTPTPPEAYRRMALAVLTTHDLPPTRAFLAGDHIKQRAELGLLDVPEAVERAT